MYDVFGKGSNPIDKSLSLSHLEVPDWQDFSSAFCIFSMLHKARKGITQHSQNASSDGFLEYVANQSAVFLLK